MGNIEKDLFVDFRSNCTHERKIGQSSRIVSLDRILFHGLGVRKGSLYDFHLRVNFGDSLPRGVNLFVRIFLARSALRNSVPACSQYQLFKEVTTCLEGLRINRVLRTFSRVSFVLFCIVTFLGVRYRHAFFVRYRATM